MTIPLNPQRGEIWRVDLEPTRGAEMGKTRPYVILSAIGIGRLPLRIVVPITGWDTRYAAYSWMIRLDPDSINNLNKVSAADTFQVCSVSLERFEALTGTLPADLTDRIATAVALCIDAP